MRWGGGEGRGRRGSGEGRAQGRGVGTDGERGPGGAGGGPGRGRPRGAFAGSPPLAWAPSRLLTDAHAIVRSECASSSQTRPARKTEPAAAQGRRRLRGGRSSGGAHRGRREPHTGTYQKARRRGPSELGASVPVAASKLNQRARPTSQSPQLPQPPALAHARVATAWSRENLSASQCAHASGVAGPVSGPGLEDRRWGCAEVGGEGVWPREGCRRNGLGGAGPRGTSPESRHQLYKSACAVVLGLLHPGSGQRSCSLPWKYGSDWTFWLS